MFALSPGSSSSTTATQQQNPTMQEIAKLNRFYKSWKVRGKRLLDLFAAAGCRFDVIMDQKEITPNFLEAMKNMDFELFCFIVQNGKVPSRHDRITIGYQNIQGADKAQYDAEFGYSNKSESSKSKTQSLKRYRDGHNDSGDENPNKRS